MHMPPAHLDHGYIWMALSVKKPIFSTPSVAGIWTICTAAPGAGNGHIWSFDIDGWEAASPVRIVSTGVAAMPELK